MNQTLIKKIKKMISQEVRDIIGKDCEKANGYSVYALHSEKQLAFNEGYWEAATKYAELMIEFAEWVEVNYIGTDADHWCSFDVKDDRDLSTSDLLTIFLKEKSKS